MNNLNENRPGYKGTKIGWIPEDWRLKPLGVLGTFSGYGFGAAKMQRALRALPNFCCQRFYVGHAFPPKKSV